MTILTPIESNIFMKLLTSNSISVILGEYPDPPPTPYPLDPYRGGPMGGLNEGGDSMSLAPKCDKFLEIRWPDQTRQEQIRIDQTRQDQTRILIKNKQDDFILFQKNA